MATRIKPRAYLKELRNKKEWTASKAAERVGVSNSHYLNIESGAKGALDVPTVDDIACAFELSAVEVFEMERKYLNSKMREG